MYTGKVFTLDEHDTLSRDREDYYNMIFSIEKWGGFKQLVVDATEMGNVLRHTNHYYDFQNSAAMVAGKGPKLNVAFTEVRVDIRLRGLGMCGLNVDGERVQQLCLCMTTLTSCYIAFVDTSK